LMTPGSSSGAAVRPEARRMSLARRVVSMAPRRRVTTLSVAAAVSLSERYACAAA
jgi:hypothetical protein